MSSGSKKSNTQMLKNPVRGGALRPLVVNVLMLLNPAALFADVSSPTFALALVVPIPRRLRSFTQGFDFLPQSTLIFPNVGIPPVVASCS